LRCFDFLPFLVLSYFCAKILKKAEIQEVFFVKNRQKIDKKVSFSHREMEKSNRGWDNGLRKKLLGRGLYMKLWLKYIKIKAANL